MYVKFGAAPTTTTYDCRPYPSGNAETCTFTNPAAGDLVRDAQRLLDLLGRAA